jgi:hypothetical protein
VRDEPTVKFLQQPVRRLGVHEQGLKTFGEIVGACALARQRVVPIAQRASWYEQTEEDEEEEDPDEPGRPLVDERLPRYHGVTMMVA